MMITDSMIARLSAEILAGRFSKLENRPYEPLWADSRQRNSEGFDCYGIGVGDGDRRAAVLLTRAALELALEMEDESFVFTIFKKRLPEC